MVGGVKYLVCTAKDTFENQAFADSILDMSAPLFSNLDISTEGLFFCFQF